MANRHLVAKLKGLLDDVDLKLFRRAKRLRRESGGRISNRCLAWWNGSEIHLAVKGHQGPEDLVLSVLHELLHGYNDAVPEQIIDEGLDRVMYASLSLRCRVLEEIVRVTLFPEQVTK